MSTFKGRSQAVRKGAFPLLSQILELLPIPDDPSLPLPLRQRLIRDLYHFLVSLTGEFTALKEGFPGFFHTLRKELYPKRVEVFTLRGSQAAGNLSRLRRLNPGWQFRRGFSPEEWQIFFLHGYIDNTGSDRAIHALAKLGYTVHLIRYPFLKRVRTLAEAVYEVMKEVKAREGERPYVLLGHSLGGLIWDELLMSHPGVVEEFSIPLYIPMGSPHFGTLAAYLAPGGSGRDMRPGSTLIREHRRREFPAKLEIYPFVSRFDLLVIPVETALWPTGINYIFSDTGHLGLVVHRHLLYALEEVMATDPRVLKERAVYRPFHLDALTEILARRPQKLLMRLGLTDLYRFLEAQRGTSRNFYLRIVPRDWEERGYPVLRRLLCS